MSKTVVDVKPKAGFKDLPNKGESHSPGSRSTGYEKHSLETKHMKGNKGDKAHMGKENGKC
jgi:hypothetical protein